jgi:anti-sigma B factor antagonist
MTSAMKINEQLQGAVMVLKPEGALVEGVAAAVKDRLIQTMTSSLGRFVVDLSAVPFVDSKGLEEVTEEMGQSGQVLRLCAANKTVREVLDLTDLAGLFDHFEDATTAVRSFL